MLLLVRFKDKVWVEAEGIQDAFESVTVLVEPPRDDAVERDRGESNVAADDFFFNDSIKGDLVAPR